MAGDLPHVQKHKGSSNHGVGDEGCGETALKSEADQTEEFGLDPVGSGTTKVFALGRMARWTILEEYSSSVCGNRTREGEAGDAGNSFGVHCESLGERRQHPE